MANPTLVKAFDSNGTNTTPITASKQTDGFLIGETVPSSVHNELFKQSIEGLNKSRNDGLWEWEDPATSDTEYNTGSMIRYLGNIYISLVDLNTETPADDGINWFTIDSVNEAYILEKIKQWQFQKVTITPDANSDYTLTISENLFGRLVLADGSWTATHNIIVDNTERSFLVDNSSGTYTATVKTSAGTGIPVLAGTKVWLLCDGTNVIESVDNLPLLTQNYTGDMDTLFESGQYVIGQSAANIPVASKYYSCFVYGNNGVSVTSQTLIERVSGNIYTRSHNGTSWSAWVSASSIGVNQTWQDVKASRSLGVTYTNSTGKPIMVSIGVVANTDPIVTFTISGVIVQTISARTTSEYFGLEIIVPNGATYSATLIGGSILSVAQWTELR